MPTIHIIYDPHNRIQTPSDQAAAMGISLVVIALTAPPEREDIEPLAAQMGRLLLAQVITTEDGAG